MVRIWMRARSLMILMLLAPVQTSSQEHGGQNRTADISGRAAAGTEQPEPAAPAATNETAGAKATADAADPADGTDGHARDHLHDDDHYEKAHGHSQDHQEQDTDTHRGHHDEEEGHQEMHHRPWTITQPGYDIRDRPRNGDLHKPVLTELIAYSDFIETVNEQNGEIVAALFFKATWKDSRVRPLHEILHGMSGFTHDRVPLPGEMKEKIWVPDLYLPMARRVAVPTIHQPAESITIKANGTVEYSAFFVIAFKCQMTYNNYPMDEQDCNLDIMSYTHNSNDLRLRWGAGGLRGQTTITTKHFLVKVIRPKGNSQFEEKSSGGKRDVLRIKFYLKRHLTFHVLQTYVPSMMLVIIGWLSLLVPLDFAYGRMVLSVTTLLVLVSIFVTTSQNTPGVNEVKALDVWLFMCIFFVFSAIVDCIVDLRFLSMVEKESQIAGEAGADGDAPPIVDERLRASRGSMQQSTLAVRDTHNAYSVVFHGNNTPFQADKEVLIATPAVLKWLRMAVFLERGMTIIYPTLFVLFTAIYWSIYLTANRGHPMLESED